MASGDNPDPGDLLLSRFALKNAQITAQLRTWLPPPDQPEADDSASEDFKGMNEAQALGSNWRETDDQVDVLLKRTSRSNEKLLEQILGKKAAAERRKEKSNIASKHAAPKPVTGVSAAHQGKVNGAAPKEDSGGEEDDDEMGRASLVGSKQQKKKRKQQQPKTFAQDNTPPAAQDGPTELGEQLASTKVVTQTPTENTRRDGSEDEAEQRPRKKQATSYLDELLNKKKKKRKAKGKGSL